MLCRERLNVGLLVGIPTALMKAECPKWWQSGAAGELGVLLKNRPHHRPAENILGVLAATEVNLNLVGRGEVVVAAVWVVDERSAHVALVSILVIEERDAHVIRVKLGAGVVCAQITLVVLASELT